MVYRVLADTVMAAHFGYLAYLVLGGFLAWRWLWTMVAHLAAVSSGVVVITFPLACPLTEQQRELVRMAGTGGYTIADLAELFTVSRTTVYRTLQRNA